MVLGRNWAAAGFFFAFIPISAISGCDRLGVNLPESSSVTEDKMQTMRKEEKILNMPQSTQNKKGREDMMYWEQTNL